VNRATVRALSALGIESRVPVDHVCCGALHAHNGELELARELARGTIEAFEKLSGPDLRAAVTNSAGCGAHMKSYGHLLAHDERWAERAKRFALSVRDLSEVLHEHAPPGGAARVSSRFAGPFTYDDPCHLCHGQSIRKQPRDLLDRLAGLERVELEDSEQCCGSAGIYAMTRPQDAARVFAPRLASLLRSGARTLVTANPGCQIQWQSGLARAGIGVEVVHIAEVLSESYEDLCSSGSGAKARISSSVRSSEAG
jgi:glycolate oxidase iron-sulfur subunit